MSANVLQFWKFKRLYCLNHSFSFTKNSSIVILKVYFQCGREKKFRWSCTGQGTIFAFRFFLYIKYLQVKHKKYSHQVYI